MTAEKLVEQVFFVTPESTKQLPPWIHYIQTYCTNKIVEVTSGVFPRLVKTHPWLIDTTNSYRDKIRYFTMPHYSKFVDPERLWEQNPPLSIADLLWLQRRLRFPSKTSITVDAGGSIDAAKDKAYPLFSQEDKQVDLRYGSPVTNEKSHIDEGVNYYLTLRLTQTDSIIADTMNELLSIAEEADVTVDFYALLKGFTHLVSQESVSQLIEKECISCNDLDLFYSRIAQWKVAILTKANQLRRKRARQICMANFYENNSAHYPNLEYLEYEIETLCDTLNRDDSITVLMKFQFRQYIKYVQDVLQHTNESMRNSGLEELDRLSYS